MHHKTAPWAKASIRISLRSDFAPHGRKVASSESLVAGIARADDPDESPSDLR